MVALQRRAGNAALQSVLQREDDSDTRAPDAVPPEQVPPGAGGPAAAAQAALAAQQAEAAATLTRLGTIVTQLNASPDPTFRHTGALFSGAASRLHYDAFTPRSDSAQLNLAAGTSAATTAYFFRGATQNNQHQSVPNTMGTIDFASSTVLVRGKYADGTAPTDTYLMNVFVHEASHILVASYGEHPATRTDAGSFDRYRDEFRAYYVEPTGPYSGKVGDDRAAAIKTHIVGTSAAPPTGYPDIQQAYWNPANAATFRAQVDAHKRPDGFNLTNRLDLDQLFTGLVGIPAGTSTIGQVLVLISRLDPGGRDEARTSSLITQKIALLPADAGARVTRALTFTAAAATSPSMSVAANPAVRAVLDAVASGDPAAITLSYGALPVEQRGNLQLNPAIAVFIDHYAADDQQRAGTYAMVEGMSVGQYQAAVAFLAACDRARGELVASPPPEMPDYLRTALSALRFTVRLTLFRLTEDIRQRHVDVLPEPVRTQVRNILRGDAEP